MEGLDTDTGLVTGTTGSGGDVKGLWVVGSSVRIVVMGLRVVEVSWWRNDSTALLGDEDGQQTPGTKRLWKQMDWRKLGKLSSRAGQLLRSWQ